MDSLNESQRRISNAFRIGTISAVDHGAGVCRVKTDDNETDWLPWFIPRAGTTIEWSAPSIGEQVMVLCPEGVMNGGVALRGIYSSAFPAPSSSKSLHLTRHADGAVISYDTESHALAATLPAGGTAVITADGGITLHGPLTVNGDTTINGDAQVSKTLTAATDVIGGGKSVKGHVHSSVGAPPA
ncbi:MAG: phage baseplate assembly protein V [Flavobacteriales bacterium]